MQGNVSATVHIFIGMCSCFDWLQLLPRWVPCCQQCAVQSLAVQTVQLLLLLRQFWPLSACYHSPHRC